ncbi:Uncharacterized protein At5g41620 [Linum perenne]
MMKKQMKRGKGKGENGVAAEKKETLTQKLRNNKSVGPSPSAFTPVRLWLSSENQKLKKKYTALPTTTAHVSNTHHHLQEPASSSSSSFSSFSRTLKASHPGSSVRKIAAVFWEFQHYLPLSRMHRGGNFTSNGGGGGGGDPRFPRHHRQQNRHRGYKEKGIDLSHFFPDPSPSSTDQPESAGSLRRHIAASLIQHHRSIERSNRALQPVSPASYGSSLEMAPYNPAMTPTSSVEFKARVGDSNYNLKTSTELLKVLNRIWSLEEQHTSNMSLIKALRTELERSRVRIKELHRDQQADRREMDELMKQVAEDKLVQKGKEHDRLHAAVQSLRDELDDERKLRKRSESLHRKLARDLSDVKSSFSEALKEVEKERRSRMLLEDLCDEFATGIKDYEQEVHVLKQKSDRDWIGKADGDRLILHISESWLDERMQMRLDEAQHGFSDNSSIVDKLGFEIETFLKARRMMIHKERRNSMESVPFNEAVSAPQDVGDEDDSVGSGSQCFELDKPTNGDPYNVHEDGDADEVVKPSTSLSKKKLSSSRERVKSRSPSSLQVRFEEHMVKALSSNVDKKPEMVDLEEVKPNEMAFSRKSEIHEATEGGGGSHERRTNPNGEMLPSNPNYAMDNLIRSHIAASEAGNLVRADETAGETSCSYPSRRTAASPIRQWMAKLTNSEVEVAEASTKLPLAPKENTLKSKLLEARSRGTRSRLKLFRGSS